MRSCCIGRTALAIFAIAGAAGAHPAFSAGAEPALTRNPARDLVVETQLLAPALKRSIKQLAQAKDPGQLSAAARIEAAQRMIEDGRANGDPRTLGYAEALLEPWRNDIAAPSDVLVLRATIEQARHHFPRAREILDRVLARDAQHPQALLTRATIATVTGDYESARRDCLMLRPLAADAAAVCSAAIDAVTGAEQRAIDILRLAVGRTQGAMRAWALAALAQVFEQSGGVDAALEAYRASLAIDEDLVTRVALANLLFSQRRIREAQQSLAAAPPGDAVLLLRWQIARALDEPTVDLHHQLRERFAQAAARGELAHAREAAQFALQDGRIDDALRLARENWSAQREPADLLVFARAAHAADNKAMKVEVVRWLRRTQLRDARLPTQTKRS